MITSKQNGATEQMSIQLEYNRMYFRKEFEIAFIELFDCRQIIQVKFERDKLCRQDQKCHQHTGISFKKLS